MVKIEESMESFLKEDNREEDNKIDEKNRKSEDNDMYEEEYDDNFSELYKDKTDKNKTDIDENSVNAIMKEANEHSSVEVTEIEQLLFPHDEIRAIQDELVKKISSVIGEKKHLLVHAPTGLGKTAAALSPALALITKKDNRNINIFFLTSRHTQHRIVIDTLRKINKKFNLNIHGSSIIGKKHLCLQPGVDKMHSKEFSEFCKLLVEDGKCIYYEKFRGKEKLSLASEAIISQLKSSGISPVEDIVNVCSVQEICPYEISLQLGKAARVIVCDYHHLFNPHIREGFLKKINKSLDNAIIIIDEAHNLPMRIKDLSSDTISNLTLKRAISEAKKFNQEEIIEYIEKLNSKLEKLSSSIVPEGPKPSIVVSLDSFTSAKDAKQDFRPYEQYIDKKIILELFEDYESVMAELEFAANAVREEQQASYIGAVASFLHSWRGPDDGFTRIISKKKFRDDELIVISYRCLDPSIIASPVISASYSTILMSGTLSPTTMYREVLGINAEELTLKSPFPEENRLNVIIPKTTTKYDMRSPQQFMEIADTLKDLLDTIPGCVAIYFPSYYLMEEVGKSFRTKTTKTVFTEHPDMGKADKQLFLDSFVKYKNTGAVLLAVVSGSFAEGIDLPGILKGVIIVGLPLQKPDLETKALIEYYDKKFSKGWDYGYLLPAFTKTFQAAGRCIRSAQDKGVIIFLDERYSWNNYNKFFPLDWKMRVTMLYKESIKKFFDEK